MTSFFAGFGLILSASIMGGLFALPLRLRRQYAVENMWVIAFILGYLIIPQIAVQILLPNWPAALKGAGVGTVLTTIAFGLGWGLGSVLFAQAIARVGVSLGYAVIMGLNTACGSMIPLFRHWHVVSPEGRALALAGIGLALVGVFISGRAGILRERAAASPGSAPTKQPKGATATLAMGLALCFLSGVLSACANLCFEFAEPIARAYNDTGVHPVTASLVSLVRWLPLYWGGTVMVTVASAWQMKRNDTWKRYRATGTSRDLLLSLLMGVFLSLTQIPYGMGAQHLGMLGTSIGFALNMTLSLVVANLAGVMTGEWRGHGRPAGLILVVGLVLLVTATVLLAVANIVS